MIKFFKKLFDFILPPVCLGCAKTIESKDSLCTQCFEKINFISAPYCQICGMPFTQEKQVNHNAHFICPNCAQSKHITRFNRSAVIYDDLAKNLILGFKFADKTENAKLFAKWLKLAGEDIFEAGTDLIIPVPISYPRLIKRKYNQSAILAQMLSKQTGIPVDVFALKKIKNTKPQSTLQGKVRLKNIKNAFIVKDSSFIKNKRILLVDDVMTTGATLSECAKVLLKAGALCVDTLTVARTDKD